MKQKEKGEEGGKRRNGRMKREENFFKGKKMGKHNTRYHSTRSRQSSTDRHRLRTSHRNGTEPKPYDPIPVVCDSHLCRRPSFVTGIRNYRGNPVPFQDFFDFRRFSCNQNKKWCPSFDSSSPRISSYLLASPRTASHLSRYPIGGTLVNLKTRFSFFSFLFGFLCLICSVWLQ
jgi:hypothetical protein